MKCVISKKIDRPVEQVFHIFTDLANAAGRIKGIKRLDVLGSGPIGVGTRFRETRIMFNREDTCEMLITAFEPNRSYRVEGNACGCEFVTDFRFRPEGRSTEVEMETRTRALTFFAKLMSPLALLMAGPMKKQIGKDLDDLKAVAEAAK